jgi:hypothetical protein
LTAKNGIAQAVVHLAFTQPPLLNDFAYSCNGLFDFKPINQGAVHHDAILRVV